MSDEARRQLKNLEAQKTSYGSGAGSRKLERLQFLDKRRLHSAADVLRLHEVLCFLRAYPDDKTVLAQVEKMLTRFSERSDVRRFRRDLINSGVAGTSIEFSFFACTAEWLAHRCGSCLTILWKALEQPEKLEQLLPYLALDSETLGLDEFAFEAWEWIERMKGPDETDATFLMRRLEQLPMTPLARETTCDDLGLTFELSPGPDTPARTREKYERASTVYQSEPLRRSRPSVAEEMARPPHDVHRLSPQQGRTLVDLARSAMVVRQRDLDAFAYGDPNDVRIVDCGGGLQLVYIGVVPERRLILEAMYGFLMLKNGVPIGYGVCSGLFQSAEVAYTVFDTFRSGEAAAMFVQVLVSARHLFGFDTFVIAPYQIGQDNEDAIRSGAWWFYQKLGFRPRETDLLELMDSEQRRMKADPTHRSSAATLRKLATANIYLSLNKHRDDVLGLLPLANVGLRITDNLAQRFGHDRRRAEQTCAREAAQLLGMRSRRRFSSGESLAWTRWSPLVLILPGIKRWKVEDKRALAALVRAKGGRRESDYLRQFDQHRRLRKALQKLATSGDDRTL